MRINARWEALNRETLDTYLAKAKGEKYVAPLFKNGDSLKQLFERSRYMLLKKDSLWTTSQRESPDSV